ncbi:MAG: PEP/pyruvate-binding domain-containing protein [Xanthomonadales bacterium]|nr:PEP/pyruvate-binding domain-containing protein [Xanthomonadales bacterium]
MKPVIDLKDFEQGSEKFDSLMPFKVRNILLVSSLYDIYSLREDGQLANLVMSEYAELRLSSAPLIKRVDAGSSALKALKKSSFDLIIVFRSLSDIDPLEFTQKAKKLHPDIPVVLLAFHHRELELIRGKGDTAFDDVFFWSGESRIFLTIIKIIEDKKNVEEDTQLIGVRVIILVENSVRFYSSFLPLIYTETMQQTSALLLESINSASRLLRMRARPKILLAKNFEEAVTLFKKYKKYLLGVISDIQFSKDGRINKAAGIQLAKMIKKEVGDLPVLLQSSNDANAEKAEKCDAGFLNKRSPTLLSELGAFINKNFGFGDFVFKLPDGSELGRAHNFSSMRELVTGIDIRSLVYHAERNHFSNWMMARTEFDLAARLRPKKASEFKNGDEMRTFLIKVLDNFLHERQVGVITDFVRDRYDGRADFLRIGEGSLGGKGRGLAFVNNLIHCFPVNSAFEGTRISVPRSAVICTGAFDQFMEINKLTEFALGDHTDEEIFEAFTSAKIPPELVKDLKSYLSVADFPLAVRSSSLLEDSHYQPFAGIYDTYFLPNNYHSLRGRLSRLLTAIKLIYASVYCRNSKNYIEATGNRAEEEKMAIIMQEIVGRNRDGQFYPVLSGLARSYNFYSVGRIKPEEGIAYLAVGLGKTVMEGENCLFFSPANPQVLPQFSGPQDYLRNTQREFFAVNMNKPSVFPKKGGEDGLVKLKMTESESHGVLKFVGSTYSADNDRIYPGIGRKGTRIVTFDPILKSKIFPLDSILQYLLQLGSHAMNVPVEMEFAVEMSSEEDKPHEFRFLQIRPMLVDSSFEDISIFEGKSEQVFCKSDQALSHGRIDDIRDIVFVKSENFDRANMIHMANHVAEYNQLFKDKNQPYLLLGPGRWGTSDRWLGIPTKWDQISSARVIVEADYGDFVVEPSFGTHFFQNLITFQIGYLTINSQSKNNFLDWDWLNSIKAVSETEYVRHVRLKRPMNVLIDGRIGKAVVFKPDVNSSS